MPRHELEDLTRIVSGRLMECPEVEVCHVRPNAGLVYVRFLNGQEFNLDIREAIHAGAAPAVLPQT